ncbi:MULTISPECIES: hypothetical protein [unclassified Sphingobacterium]|uniref:hypothetical protein n=1 Tax=unclassified Sphingobacterium TaxID=2609468 RepID=UPI00104385B8|nr:MULTISPECIES: hypothetical protein [unclassified Sphingobacterium]MCS3556574.1 hypothetical protein [Sphingobacterium sp. JUb21]TCQ99868.1 hypothetical protein EDF66_11393 [Sphingobacterium sp. JUb20]
MKYKVDIVTLKNDIQKRFGEKTNSSEFIITMTNLKKRKGENISFVLEHYSNRDLSYKFSFPSFIAFEMRDGMLTQEADVKTVKFNADYDGIIIHQILEGMYLNFLKAKTALQIYSDIGALEDSRIQQYSLYGQDRVVDIVTIERPTIFLIEHTK